MGGQARGDPDPYHRPGVQRRRLAHHAAVPGAGTDRPGAVPQPVRGVGGNTMKKIYISQPMRGRSTDAIIAERKALVADAAVALQTDEVEVLDTYLNGYTNKPPLHLLALALEKMADA